MAGSAMAFTYDRDPGPIKRVIVDWTSDSATGAVTGTTKKISGRLIKATTDPGATAPTDDYDITLTDDEGVNILAACDDDLADRDTANSEEVYFRVKDAAAAAQSLHPVVCSPIGIAIANAGNSKVGQLILFIEGEIAGHEA